MQKVDTAILALALEKYEMAVVNVAKKPTLYKIVNGQGKMVVDEYFSNTATAELKLMAIVKEKEKDAKKSK